MVWSQGRELARVFLFFFSSPFRSSIVCFLCSNAAVHIKRHSYKRGIIIVIRYSIIKLSLSYDISPPNSCIVMIGRLRQKGY
ncbi:hypothetical protein F4814DRAFT_418282 [Daldinia grandis]|nr:hypothetical protein F4814DRAFT_418282 [Daldinia grandis]